MSRCYAVASGKGGVGKSVITSCIAASLAQKGIRVLIVDADIGLRSQDTLLSVENRVVYDLIDVIKEECMPDQAILSSELIPSLHLLPAAQFDRVRSLDPKKLARLLQTLRCIYEYIFIDCPAGIERGLRNVLNAGFDEGILIVTPDDISVRSAERAAQLMESKRNIRPHLIVNRLDRKLIRTGEMMSAQTISQVLDLPLLGCIPEDSAVCRSLLRHELFINYHCEARNAVNRIAGRIQGQSIPVVQYGSKKDHPLRKLFSHTIKEVSPIDDY